jgi:hypothetical protein
MIKLSNLYSAVAISVILVCSSTIASSNDRQIVSDAVIADQRAELVKAAARAGFGPQSPRDIDVIAGNNHRTFGSAPAYTKMNLCNIHFHENAEHKGGQFSYYAGNGDGKGNGTGYKYNGKLSHSELTPARIKIGVSEHGDLASGDTIEIHFVYSSAQVIPGPTLGACISKAIKNPQLRVETVVAVLVNDPGAVKFTELAKVEKINSLYQATNLPTNLGAPVVYAGSTTGPSYNEQASPYQVTWSIRPRVTKVDVTSVGKWLADNVFGENHAHGVRNLVINADFLSKISN